MAAMSVGCALLSSFLQVAFDRLASREILDYFRGRKLETLLKRLNTTLWSINAVIDDAEDKQIINRNVKAWVDEVKDAVYLAEDLLDEIDTELSKRKQLEAESGTSTASKVWNFFSASVSSFDKEIEERMKQILYNLEYLASQKDILGLREGGRKLVSQRMPSTSLVDETVIYGRDDEKEMIINWLLPENENGNRPYSVISIVGMGGMGKTTLAQLVYNDQRLTDEFDLKAWVCVSEEFDLLRVTKTTLEAITLAADDTKNLNTLQLKLKEKLTGKRFFLVLDDVWNEKHMQWEALQTPFIYGAQGSKILVTTRSDKVASTVRSARTHQLMQLLEENSWLLFATYAFHEGDPQSNPNLEEIGRKIIKKCKGLPLALKAIGSLLYAKLSSEEWNTILTSEIWDMSDDESEILPALRLSYTYLSSLLKRCFAYCSLFPKDFLFKKEHLIRLWMAENFLPFPQQNKSMKEVGDQFFHDLLSRSFFQRSSVSRKYFIMHDLVNDLAKYVSGEFCFRLEEEAQAISKKTRHFSYLRSHSPETSKRFDGLLKANNLRTFLPFSMYHDKRIVCWMPRKMIHDLCCKFKHLRVLSLSGYYNIIELPDSIGNQKQLRYLDLSRTGVKKLPDSTCMLYNLQTLKLRHCTSLVELPSDLHKLSNLRHLDFRNTKVRKMPMQLEKLKNLQVLSSFYVGKCHESNIKQLSDLDLWGTLSILELQKVVYPTDASAANMKDKIHLEELKLEWGRNNTESQIERDVLERLQPHKNLKKLSISYYGGTRFPDWFRDNTLSNVVSLELCNCKYCFFLSPLGLLPNLKTLSLIGLDGIVVIGADFYGNCSSTIPFGRLKILKFENMGGLEKWECKSRVFPQLQKLYLIDCPKLKEELPQQLPSLRELTISSCQQLAASVPWAPVIKKLVLKQCLIVRLEYIASTLKILEIRDGPMERSLLEKIQHTIANSCLEKLYILDFEDISFPIYQCHNFLLRISICASCDSLTTFPLDFFPKLQSLYLESCYNLEAFSVSDEPDHNLTSLTRLEIWACPKFVSFPKGGLSAPRLEYCRIELMKNLKSFPERMHILLPSLKTLNIGNCPQLESFPEGGLPLNLKALWINNCPKLIASRMNWGLRAHTCLDRLTIGGAVTDVECLPDEGLLPPSLTYFGFLDSNLTTLNYKGLCDFCSLKELYLHGCPRLQSLPEEGLPSSLSTLSIVDCPMLKQRCQSQKGEDWGKIAHIQRIIIDNDTIT